jgi:peptidoglycan/LPS O-acetylase OafA/YrhL
LYLRVRTHVLAWLGIAAALVVLTHYHQWCAPWSNETAPAVLTRVFSLGDLGMTLFFTLSGFVIAYNYVDLDWRKAPLSSAARFTWLRFSRLYPLLLVFILMTVSDARLENDIGEHYGLWVTLHVLSIETWVPAQLHGALPVNSTFNVSWSIATEFMLYAMFAMAMLAWSVMGRSKAGVVAFIAVVAGYCAVVLLIAHGLQTWPPLPIDGRGLIEPMTRETWFRWFVYQSPYFRVLDFGFGVIAALIVLRLGSHLPAHRVSLRILAAAALVGVIVLHALSVLLVPAFINSNNPLLQLGFAGLLALIMLNGEDDSRLNRALSSSALVGLGTISYSLYLIHPFVTRLGTWKPYTAYDPGMIPHYIVNFALALVLAVAIAVGLYRVVELPAQRMLRNLVFRSRRLPHPASAALGSPAE